MVNKDEDIKRKPKLKEEDDIAKYHPRSTITSATVFFLFVTIATTIYQKHIAENILESKPTEKLKKENTVLTKNKTIDEIINLGNITKNELPLTSQKSRKTTITNSYDRKILKYLNEGEQLFKQRQYPECVSFFEKLYKKYPKSARSVFGQAKCLEKLSENMRSNQLLRNALKSYERISTIENVPEELVKLAYTALGENYHFLGELRRSTLSYEKLSQLLPFDYEVLMNVGISYLHLHAHVKSAPYFEKVLNIRPNDGWAKVHLGFVYYSVHQYEAAAKWLHEGIRTGDKGVDGPKFYFYLGDAYNRIGRHHESWKVYHLGAEKGIFLSAMQRSFYNAESKLRAQPWWTVEETGYEKDIRLLEYYWKTIRDEAVKVMNKEKNAFQLESESLTEKGDWKQLELYAQGQKLVAGCKYTPRTCEIIEQMKGATNNKRGQIKFSLMQPSTHIWAHTGPTNCRLRVHLGLIIPKNVHIRVGEDTRTWKNGKALVFDDSFEHEVWHNGSEARLIMIIDFYHPDLPKWEIKTLTPM